MAKKIAKKIKKRVRLPKNITVAFHNLPQDTLGYTFANVRLIMIDLCKDENIGETFLHEMLHLKFPDLPEKKVENLAHRLWKEFDQGERYEIYKRLFRYPSKIYIQ